MGERRGRPSRAGRWAVLVACAAIAAVAVVIARDPAPRRPAVWPATPAASAASATATAVRSSPPPRRSALVVGGRRQPPRVRVPWAASGRYSVVRGTAAAPRGRRGVVVRYLVEVERGLPFRGREFAAAVHRILNDPRGWGSGGRMRFARTDHEPVRLRVSLSSPALSSRGCLPLDTGGQLSCWHRPRAIINALRWGKGRRQLRPGPRLLPRVRHQPRGRARPRPRPSVMSRPGPAGAGHGAADQVAGRLPPQPVAAPTRRTHPRPPTSPQTGLT